MHTETITFQRPPRQLSLRSGGQIAELPVRQAEMPEATRQTEAELAQLRQLLGHLEASLIDLQHQQRASLGELQQVAVELGVQTASWLTGAAIDRDVFAVDQLVSQALTILEMNRPTEIRLHPEDCRLLADLTEQEEYSLPEEEITVVPDRSIQRGVCRAESARRSLVSDWKNRLEDIHRQWLESLDDTQVERRADDPNSRGFRRFPERRETA